jgi:uncharacterized surface protein with fasciclin (FAS1) repeats
MSTHRHARGLIAAVATAALAVTGALATAPTAQAAGHRPTSLAQVLAADGHHFDRRWNDFDILDRAVLAVLREKPNSPVAVLTKGRTKLTAFLPTDRAFRRLAVSLTGHRPATERATFRRIVRTVGIDTVEAVLLYHVVPGKTLGSRKVLRSDGAKLTTAQGGTVTVNVVGHKQIRLIDADPDLRNPRVVAADINKGNPQIAHAINRVLLPIDV